MGGSGPGDIYFGGAGITIASSTVVRVGDSASLSIVFDDPVDSGEGFALNFGIGNLTDAEFILSQMPTSTGLPGNFDGDGDVDGEDLLIWETAFGVDDSGDANGDGDTDGADFLIWQRSFGSGSVAAGAVPEPSTIVVAVLGGLFGLTASMRRRWQ